MVDKLDVGDVDVCLDPSPPGIYLLLLVLICLFMSVPVPVSVSVHVSVCACVCVRAFALACLCLCLCVHAHKDSLCSISIFLNIMTSMHQAAQPLYQAAVLTLGHVPSCRFDF